MKFGLHPNELNVWKGRITERVAMTYFEDILIPFLKEKEGWTDIFKADLSCPINRIEKELIKGNKKVIEGMEDYQQSWYLDQPRNIISELLKNFLSRCIYPNEEFLNSCIKLLLILEVATDGIIFKTRKINETIKKGKAISQINKNYYASDLRTGNQINFFDEKDLPEQIPLVTGEIEILEVKSGNACIPYHQIEDYQRAIENGFYLRYFHVGIITFRGNSFEIKEKLITNPREVTKYPLGKS